MDLNTFLDHFATIAEAPGGIAKLRALILDLAVQGKLVPQDPEDEPASKLLGRIQADVKKISHKKNSIQNISELPFNLPATWETVCLDQITREVHYGLTVSASFSNNQIKLLRITDIQDNSVNWSSVPGCDVELDKAKKYRLSNGDIVIARTGGTVGKSYLVNALKEEDFAVFASYLIRVVPVQHINYRYLKLVLESPVYWIQLSSSTTGTGQPNVNATSLKGFVLPLPPLAEQKRIVEKVDELMALCDRLAAAKQTRDDLRQKLRGSAIAALMNAETDEALEKSWAIVRDTWHSLSQDPKDVDGLRKSVLQLAVRGALTHQDPNDEASSILLERIGNSKKELVQRDKLKKSIFSNEPSTENFFELPETWKWARLDDIALQITDGEHATPPRISNPEVPLGTAKNVRDGFLDLSNTDYVSIETAEKCWKRCKPSHNDILMVCVGATTGRLCLVKEPSDFVIVRSVALIRPFADFVYPEYIALAINSPLLQQQVWSNVKQSAQPCLYINRMQILILPIPPLAEQKRIVAKVDELMQMCDQLEVSLRQSQQRASALAASAISHLTL